MKVNILLKGVFFFLSFFPYSISALLFEDISGTSGFTATHTAPSFGIGQAFIDVNKDGYLDIFVTNQLGPNHLFINQKDETFLELESFDNLKLEKQKCNGVSVADFDNDGWDDIYINCVGDNHLFKNIYGTSFLDVSNQSGTNDQNNSQVSAWADINNDGWLDLYVVNFNNGDSDNPDAALDSFYLSNKDSTFTNIIADFNPINTLKPGLAVTFFDYDNDNDQDLYVLIDKLHGNVLWRNDGPATNDCGIHWCFKDVSEETNTDLQIYGMGIATGDIDLDGDYDMYFTSVGEQFLLLNQTSQGSATFIDASLGSPLNMQSTAGWGTLFFDYDNDSFLDAMIATYGSTTETAEKLFKGFGNGSFSDVTQKAGISDFNFTEGIAFGDINNDGLLDIIKGNRNDAYKIYKNTTSTNNNWLKLNLIGYNNINRNAIGTKVTLLTTDGKSLIREVTAGDSRGSTNQRALHFGLSSSQIDSITIDWTNGEKQLLNNVSVNYVLNVVNPSGQSIFFNGFE